jgi:BMFP domain-containing protein YqiC
MTMDPKIIEELARKLAATVPGSVRALQADLERNFRALLQATFDKLDLVTREEFDVQRRVLERTRERLTRLEAELARLEGAAGDSATGSSTGDAPAGDPGSGSLHGPS